MFLIVDFITSLFELLSLQIISLYHNVLYFTTLIPNVDLFWSLVKLNLNQTLIVIVDRHPHPIYSLMDLRTNLINFSQMFKNQYTFNLTNPSDLVLHTSNVRGDFSLGQQSKMLEENTQDYRSTRNQNPVFKPDFKSGNFFTRDDFARKPFLLTTISDISKGMRRPV